MDGQRTNISFGSWNSGSQIAQNFGPVHFPSERAETPPLPSHNVPFPRDPDFVEHGNILDRLRIKLSEPAARVALTGLAGIGKSQLAIEYAHQLRKSSPETWVLWIYASDAARFEQGVREIAELIKLRGRNDPRANIFQLFRAWLWDTRHGDWLIILDNVDDSSFLICDATTHGAPTMESYLDYIPVCDNGSVLITTGNLQTAQRLVDDKNIIDVSQMNEDPAILLLEKKFRGDMDRKDLIQLATALDFVPLAITQAAAYITRAMPRCTISEYIAGLPDDNASSDDILDCTIRDLRRHRDSKSSITSVWQVSFSHIQHTKQTAAALLSLMSLCDHQMIPEYLLRDRVAPTGPRDNSFEQDIAILRAYKFISLSSDGSTFFMPRLVQLATRKWLQASGRFDFHVEHLAAKLNVAFPGTKFQDWHLSQALFAHVKGLAHLRPETDNGRLQWASVMHKATVYALSKGGRLLWSDAAEMATQCWNARKVLLGGTHADTLASMSNVSESHYRQGDNKGAVENEETCLELKRTSLGDTHEETLLSMANLAKYVDWLGYTPKAAELGEQCWLLRHQTCGPDHPETLKATSSLARYLSRLGQVPRAANMERHCLAQKERLLGKDHPDTLDSLSNLARYHSELGECQMAVELEERCLEIRKVTIGERHADTFNSMIRLCGYHYRLGDHRKAVEMGHICWKLSQNELGVSHPVTLLCMSKLSRYHCRLGAINMASQMEKQCWDLRDEKLGHEHPETLFSMSAYAEYLHRLGNTQEAVELEERCWKARQRILGHDHQDTVSSLSHLQRYRDWLLLGRNNRYNRTPSRSPARHLTPSRSPAGYRASSMSPPVRHRTPSHSPAGHRHDSRSPAGYYH